jgi:hypothetical protein
MNMDDIKEANDKIIDMNNKMFKALRMHTDIAVRRNAIMANLELIYHGTIPESELASNVQQLIPIHNQERRLMEVIDPYILRSQSDLKNIIGDNKKKIDKNVRDIGKLMLKALEIIIAKIKLTYTRFDKEVKFISNQNQNTYSEYSVANSAEKTADEKLLMLLNPAQMNVFTEFLKYDEEELEKTKKAVYISGGVAAGGTFAIGGTLPEMVWATTYTLAAIGIIRMIGRYRDEVQNVINQQKSAMQEFTYKKPPKDKR